MKLLKDTYFYYYLDILPEFDVLPIGKKLHKKYEAAFKIYSECDCLSSCASLDYDYDSSQADYNWIEGYNNKVKSSSVQTNG